MCVFSFCAILCRTLLLLRITVVETVPNANLKSFVPEMGGQFEKGCCKKYETETGVLLVIFCLVSM